MRKSLVARVIWLALMAAIGIGLGLMVTPKHAQASFYRAMIPNCFYSAGAGAITYRTEADGTRTLVATGLVDCDERGGRGCAGTYLVQGTASTVRGPVFSQAGGFSTSCGHLTQFEVKIPNLKRFSWVGTWITVSFEAFDMSAPGEPAVIQEIDIFTP